MGDVKYIGMDMHQGSSGESLSSTAAASWWGLVGQPKPPAFCRFFRTAGRTACHLGAWAAWLYDLLKPHVHDEEHSWRPNPRRNTLLKEGDMTIAQARQLVPLRECCARFITGERRL